MSFRLTLSLVLAYCSIAAAQPVTPRFSQTTIGFVAQGEQSLSYMAIGDLNRDGHPDIVSTNVANSTVSVMLGKGDGTFQSPKTFKMANIPFPVVLADLNGDGFPDMIVGSATISDSGDTQGHLEVMLGKGDGTFQPSTVFPMSGFPVALAVADFNHDGKIDIAIENSGINSFGLDQLTDLGNPGIQVFSGDGKGGLTAGTNQPMGAYGGLRLITADWNNDGIPDLALDQLRTGAVMVLLGKGDGTFSTPKIYTGVETTQYNALELATADMNQDGKLDLVLTSGLNNQILIFNGKGDGTFLPPTEIPFNNPAGMAIDDFNGDGIPDLALGTAFGFETVFNTGRIPAFGTDTVFVLSGAGKEIFPGPAVNVAPTSIPLIIQAVDLNGDGLIDIVAMDIFNGGFTVMMNQTSSPLAVVSAASGTPALTPESLVSGYGKDLAAAITVASTVPLPTSLGGVSLKVTDSTGTSRLAPLIYVAPTQMNFQIPAGTALGSARFDVIGAPGGLFSTTAMIQAVAPTLFSANSDGKGVAAGAAIRVDNKTHAQSPVVVYTCPTGQPCVSSPIELDSMSTVFVSLYGTGIRGAGGTLNATATVHGKTAPVVYAGAQGQFAGLDQVNITLPQELSGMGESDVQITVNGQAANVVTLNIK